MILNFNSRLAEDIYHGVDSRYARKLSGELHAKALRLLDQLDSVTHIESLRVPPSNRLEKLSGDLKGYWSIRINSQWRIIFRWEIDAAYNVDIVDYH
jgi:toxin HigB-1